MSFILFTKATSFTNIFTGRHAMATTVLWNWAMKWLMVWWDFGGASHHHSGWRAVCGGWNHHFLSLFSMNLLNCNFKPVLWSPQLWLFLTFHCPFSVSPALSGSPPALVSLSPFFVSPHVLIPLPPPTLLFAPTAPYI